MSYDNTTTNIRTDTNSKATSAYPPNPLADNNQFHIDILLALAARGEQKGVGVRRHLEGNHTDDTDTDTDADDERTTDGESGETPTDDTGVGRHGSYEDVHAGRLYPNLDQLVDQGLISKRPFNNRSNTYALTGRGRRELDAYLDYVAAHAGGER